MGRRGMAHEVQGQESDGMFWGRDESGQCGGLRQRAWELMLASRPGRQAEEQALASRAEEKGRCGLLRAGKAGGQGKAGS